MATARILSLDGGGIRGIIAAMILQEIENRVAIKTSKSASIADYFHMIAGTSTGGIMALGLASPTHKMSAEQLVQFYEKDGKNIFRRSLWRGVSSLGGLVDEKYDATALESTLQNKLGNDRLSEVKNVDLLITAYEINKRDPFFFKSWRACGHDLKKGAKSAQYNFYLRDIGRATSAAPTYFEPTKVANVIGKDTYSLIDGGVFANNPVMCALASAYHLYKKADSYVVVSLGTGQLQRPIPYQDAKDWGLMGWARPLLSLIFDGVSDTADYQAAEVLEGQNYFRFQVELGKDEDDPDSANDDLDDASPENIARLKSLAMKLILKESGKLDAIADLLVVPKDARRSL